MEQQCLVITLKGTINDDSFVKLGEIRIKIAPNSSVAGKYAYIHTRSVKSQQLKLSDGAYFCTSLTDNTPVNTTKDASRTASLTANTAATHYVYFDDDYAYLTATDKYSIEGFGYTTISGSKSTWFILYDLDDVKYLTNWCRFTAPLTQALTTPQQLPSKKIITAYNYIEGDLTGFTLGDSSAGAYVRLTNVSGTLTALSMPNDTSVNMTGTFACDISGLAVHPLMMYLYSPNVSGDIGSWTDRPSYADFGTASAPCSVVCNSAPTISRGVSELLKIYSNSITKAMFANLVTNRITKAYQIYSTQLDVAEIQADTDIMALVNAVKTAGSTVKVNNTYL
jgi:hypothetical protein